MGERIGRIGRIQTDFWGRVCLESVQKSKKSVRIRPIRPIRSPIVSQNYRARSIFELGMKDASVPICKKMKYFKDSHP
jgi:hypothetical protein